MSWANEQITFLGRRVATLESKVKFLLAIIEKQASANAEIAELIETFENEDHDNG